MLEVEEDSLDSKPMSAQGIVHKFAGFVYNKGKIRSGECQILQTAYYTTVEADIFKWGAICGCEMTVKRHWTGARFDILHLASLK